MSKIFVIDASFLFHTFIFPEGEYYTTSKIYEEIKDNFNKVKYVALRIEVRDPSKKTLKELKEKLKKFKLSEADLSLIALAYELKKEGKDVEILTYDREIKRAWNYLNSLR